jgi:hypothetical protein
MTQQLGAVEHTWYVGTGEAGDYRYAGAVNVIEAGGLPEARNLALDHAADQGRTCIQVSDDLVRLVWADGTTRADVRPVSFGAAIVRLELALLDTGAHYAGCAPTDNPFFMKPGISSDKFVVGDLTAHTPQCPIRYRTGLRLKEDYDMTLQHLAAYGKVARVDQLLATFRHRTNRGGAVETRSADPAAEAAAADWLLAAWPEHLHRNTRRKGHELLLKWKPLKHPSLPADGPSAEPAAEWHQPAPYAVQLEPVEGCNLRCGFCGIRGIREKGLAGDLSGPYRFMTKDTVARIASGMADAGWSPRIELAMHGEPTMHPDLPGLVELIRHHLFKSQIMVTTNGIPLLDGRGLHYNLDALFHAGVNVVALDDYRPHLVAPEARGYTGATVCEYPADPDGNPHTRRPLTTRLLSIVADISQADTGTHSSLGNHAGAAAPPTTAGHGKRCAKPFRELSFRWDGTAAICCNDWRGQFQIGSITDGLEQVWQHPAMHAARRFLIRGDRHELEPCNGCDHLSYRVGLLPDKHGKITLPAPTDHDRDLVGQATEQGTLTPVVLRRWEKGSPFTPRSSALP